MPFKINKHKTKEKDAKELATLVQTKFEVINNMEGRLVQAKMTIAKLKAEVDALCNASTDGPPKWKPRSATNVMSAAIVWRASTVGTLKSCRH